jgi:hypothetical protein
VECISKEVVKLALQKDVRNVYSKAAKMFNNKADKTALWEVIYT